MLDPFGGSFKYFKCHEIRFLTRKRKLLVPVVLDVDIVFWTTKVVDEKCVIIVSNTCIMGINDSVLTVLLCYLILHLRDLRIDKANCNRNYCELSEFELAATLLDYRLKMINFGAHMSVSMPVVASLLSHCFSYYAFVA